MYTVDRLSTQLCRDNPDTIYVFGDNLIGKGCAGQAQIRYENNAVGVPTKRLPSMSSNAFFSDQPDEYLAVENAINHLVVKQSEGYRIVFPSSGLGTGLARMKALSPCLFEHMNNLINKHFGKTPTPL
jgi:hypothetical protein